MKLKTSVLPIKNLLLLFYFFLFSIAAFAQTTKVSGRIFDSESNEPLPFVNVLFKGTRIGITSDFDGNFVLSTTEKVDSILFSYIGYLPNAKAVKRGVNQVLRIEMTVNSVALKEVVIKPGENPANILFKKVVQHKNENDFKKLEAYQYETYNKIEIDINNISDKMKKRKLLKPFDFVFDNIDSTNKDEKPSLPMFIAETMSDFYFKRNPKYKKEIIKASKVAGLKNESVSQVLGNMYQQVDIYDNAIVVIDKNFTSPLSDNGLFFYRYYLIDSLFLDNHWCYQLQFKPRRKQELAFIGNMWIADTTFAVKRLEMSIPDDANINYIVALNVIQDYELVDNNWMLSKDKLVIDFALLDKKKMMGLYGRKTTSYKNIVLNKPQEENFYSKTDNLKVLEGANDKDAKFWKEARHDTLSKNEESIYQLVDTIRSIKAFKSYSDLIKTLYSGYYVYKKIELGPLFSTISGNQIEGVRLRVGGRTSNEFSKWFELNGYTAYGFEDEKYKVGAGFRWMLQKKPTRQMLSFNYKNDYEILGQNANTFHQDNLFVSIFRRNPLTNLTKVESYVGFYDKEWFNGFNTKITLAHRIMTPLGGTQYLYIEDKQIKEYLNIKSSEIVVNIRFAYSERFLDGEFDRVSLGTKSPIFQLYYTEGLKGVFGSDFNYRKAIINIDDRIRINPIGYTNYVLEYGKVFGKAPYPLLELHPGNETFVYDYYAFNLMNYFEFVSDEYASVKLVHHFDGFFFNRVPLLRKLKLREVAACRAIVGKVSKSNREAILFPTDLYSLNQLGHPSTFFVKNKPYAEVGAGIENILKFFRVDAMWRLTYLDHPNIAKFGFRVTVQLLL